MRKHFIFLNMLLVNFSLLYAQQNTVSGNVIGQDGNPIPFATVRIIGNSNGTKTDENGHFFYRV